MQPYAISLSYQSNPPHNNLSSLYVTKVITLWLKQPTFAEYHLRLMPVMEYCPFYSALSIYSNTAEFTSIMTMRICNL